MEPNQISKTTARIGLIGAGASGLSAAHYLKEAGYTNVTVLEKERRVGANAAPSRSGGMSTRWARFWTRATTLRPSSS